MNRLATSSGDAISDALSGLNVRSTVFCVSELRAPWAFSVGGAPMAKFHLVLDGEAWLTSEGQPPIRATAGDLVLLLRGQPHAMGSALGLPSPGLDELIEAHPLDDGLRLRCGGLGEVTRLLCGGFVTDQKPIETLVVAPDVLHVDGRSLAPMRWLTPTLHELEAEAVMRMGGALAVQTKIADVFITQGLRAWLRGAEQLGVLPPALLPDDHAIARAVAVATQNLAAKWTIWKLASLVGLSRTAFVSRFRRTLGTSPMRYIARVRISTAAGLLVTTERPLHEIAATTGYESAAALSKAFSRELGVAPGAYRSAMRNQGRGGRPDVRP